MVSLVWSKQLTLTSMHIVRTSSAAAAAAARLSLDLAPVDVLHPQGRSYQLIWSAVCVLPSPLCPLGCNGPRFARAGLLPCARNKDGQGR